MVFTAFFLFGCSSFEYRKAKAFDLAKDNHYELSVFQAKNFPIQLFIKSHASKHAVIYLEGDGLVLNAFGELAQNPTPTDPVALKLAIVDDRSYTKIIINRPFQYTASSRRDSKYWTTARYSAEVIQSVVESINAAQQKFAFDTFELVAYSGGAAVALLLVPHFQNITHITSFAGNLDHQSWTDYHDTQSLFQSLDPMQNKELLCKVKQAHYAGTRDDNTTLDLANAYKDRLNCDKIRITPIEGYSHDSDWTRVWREQLKLKWQQ